MAAAPPPAGRRPGLARLLGPLAACAALLGAPCALAQSPSVALSVPAGTGLAEGEGNTTVTVTATLSAARPAATVIDLSLAGTAKDSDYDVVGTLPDITVPAGSLTGTADIVLFPTDDNFFEGPETVSVGGTSGTLTVTPADIALADNDTAPTFTLRLEEPGTGLALSTNRDEGDAFSFTLEAALSGGSTLEEDATVTVTRDTMVARAASDADLDFGSNPPPWSIAIEAGSTTGRRDVSVTIVDDTEREGFETVKFDARFDAGGETFTGSGSFSIGSSDQPISVRLTCASRGSNGKQYPGAEYVADCQVSTSGRDRAPRDYTVTYDISQGQADQLDPDRLAFELKSGTAMSAEREVTFTAAPDVGTFVEYQGTISPNDRGESAASFNQSFWPAADSGYTIDAVRVSPISNLRTNDPAIVGQTGFVIFFGTRSNGSFRGFPRPSRLLGSPRVEVELDSGLVSVPCSGDTFLTCRYVVRDGDYDFDRKIVIPAGGLKFTGWRDLRDLTVTGTVAAALQARMTLAIENRIAGGSHAIGLSVSPATLQEGAGERELTVSATNLRGETSASDLVIPLAFANVTTTGADWSVRGGPYSVTIPAGLTDGDVRVPFTAVDDLVREAAVERVRVEGSRGAMTTPFVQGADIRILDAAGITLTASPATVAEDGGAQQVMVTAAWGDAGDPALTRDLVIDLAWGGSAGSGDYARSGGDSVTIKADDRSGTVTATVTPTDDLLFEGDETISIRGSVPGRTVTATEVTLTDDETRPAVSLSVTPDSFGEGDAAATEVTVSATLDPEVAMASGDATVTLDLAGAATEGTDYTASWSPAARTITIPAGETEGSGTVRLTLTPRDDETAEGDETVTVEGTATDANDKGLVVHVADVTLEDDDTAAVRLSETSLTVAEGATGTYTVVLGAQPTGDVTVTVAPVQDTPVVSVDTDAGKAGDQDTLTFTATDWSTARTVTVRGTDDSAVNAGGGRASKIVHTPGGGGYGGVAAPELGVTVTDDDSALLVFAPTSLTVAEGGSGTYTVALASQPTDDVTVTATAPDGLAVDTDAGTEGDQDTLEFTAEDWNTAQTVTVTAADDDIDQGASRSLSVGHAASGGDYASVSANLSVTVTDDDATPTATLVLAPATINESGATNASTVTATLSGATSEAVTLTVSAGPGVTVSDNKVLTFAAGATASAGAVTLTAVDNDVDAADLGVSVSAAASGGNGVAAPAAVTLTVTDDDARGVAVSVKALTLAEADDSGTPGTKENEGTYTVALGSEPAAGTVTVAVASADTKAATVSPASLTFTTTDWNVQKTVTVTAVPDAIDNPAEKRTVRITHRVTAAGEGTDYGTVTADPLDVTVTDDDGPPTVSVADADDVTEGDDTAATTDMTFTVTLSAASGKAVTVPYTLTGTATADEDYADPATKSVTVAAGGTTGTITIPVKGDTIDEGNETVTVTLGEPTNATVSTAEGAGTANGTITDDDTATLSVADASAAEGGTATFTVTLSTPSAATVTVTATTSEGTATDPEDYTHRTVTLTFAAGDTSKDFTVTTIADSVAELDETFTVTLSNPGGATIADATATGTITGAAALLSVADASATEGDAVAFTVTRTGDTAGPASVQWTTGDDASEGAARATAGTDYTARTTARTLSFQAGDATATFNVATAEDPLDEPDETFAVTLASPSDGVAISRASAVGTITDDDATPTATLVLAPATIDESGATNASTVTATLSGATSEAVTLTVSAGPGVTVSDNKVLTFAAGATASAGAVTLTAVDNDVDAADLGVSVSAAASGGNGVAAPAAVTLTVTDDDARGVAVSVKALTLAEADDSGTPGTKENEGTYTVALGSEPAAGTVTVAVASADTKAATVSPASLTFTTTDWSVQKTVTVTAVPDAIDNPAEKRTVRITHRVTAAGEGTDYGTVTADPLDVTVTDDDGPPTVSVADADDVTEGDDTAATTDMTFTVTLSAASGKAVTVPYTLTGTATADEDYADPATKSVTVAAGGTTGTITIPVKGDTIDEGNETVTVTLGEPTNATVSTAEGAGTANGTITDDDTATLSVADASAAEGGTATFTVTLSTPSAATVTVTATTSEGTATDPEDYTHRTVTLTFAAGDTSKDFTVTTIADSVAELDETFTVTLSNPGGATIADATATGTITGAAALLSVADASATEGDAVAFTVTRTGDTAGPASVQWTTGDDASEGAARATAGTDYTARTTARTLSFQAGDATATFNVATAEDPLDEPDETFAVTLASPSDGVAISRASAVGTITDDDATPTATLVLAPATINESGATNASTVTATLSGATSEAVTLTVSAGPGVTVSDNKVLTFAAGATASAGAVTLTAVDNDVDAADLGVSVSAAASGGNGVAAPAAVTLTVTDDDARGVAVSVKALTLAEADDSGTPGTKENEGTYTVALGSEPAAGTVTVAVASADTKAATVSPASLTFTTTDWNVQKTVTVTAVPDAIDNPAEKRTVRITHRVTAAGEGTDYGTVTADPLDVTVTDDDGPPTVSVADADDVTEGDDTAATTDMTFTVTLSAASGKAVTVPYTLTGTATADEDYADPATKSVTVAAGGTTGTITIPVKGDTIDEGNETVTVTLGEPTNATVSTAEGAGTANGTITDDDTATLSVADASAAEGGTATFTVTLSTPSAATVTVTATTSEGTATDPEDYTHRTVTLTFAAGDTSKDFTVTTIADSVAELDETFTVTLSNPGGATIADATATGTITGAAALLSVADASATEGDAVAFTVTRTGDTAGPASVQWTTGDDASEGAARATAGTDYTARTTARTLSFQAGDATATFNVATAEDPLDEPDETFAVTLASPSDGVAISRASAVGTITDDDATPTATLVLDPATIDESGATNASTVTATLSGATSEAVTLTVSAGPGVTVSDNKVLTFAAGATASAGAVTLTAVDNDVDAADLGVSVSAAASGGNGVAAPAAVTLTVTDDDARGVAVSVKALTLAEADDSGTPGTKENEGTYTVALGSEPAAGTVTVAVASADTKAATVSPASLTFTTTDWNVQKTVTVTAVPDAIDNPAEKRTVRITHRVTAAGEGTDYGTVTADPLDVTVTDDDGPPTVSVADADDVTEGDDTAATTDMTFTVTLSAASGKAVTVPYTLTGTATADEDYADPATKSVTVAAGGTTGTITIPVKGDTIDEGNETVTVTLGEPTNATVSTAEGAGTANGTITDDDTATLSVADASAAEGGTATFTVTLSTPSAATVTVTATTSEGTATDPEDYTHRTVTLTFAAGDTSKDFTVTTIADSVAELDETFTVTLSNPGGATIADATATGTITGAAALLSVADASATEGDAVAFTVTRTGDTAGPASVQWTTGDDASEGAARATAGTDYTARTTARTLSFQAGDATATFNVATAEDPLDEPDETFAVTLASPSDGVAISRASAVGTITDDDATPTATLVLAPATIDESGATNASTVTATLSGATSEAVTLTVSAGPGVTVSDNKVLTFAAGATASAGAVTLTAVDNDVDAADLGVSVSAAASGGNGVAAPAAVTLTVTDDDARGVAVSVKALTLAEADDSGTPGTKENEGTYTVALGSEPAAGTVTVAVASADTKAATVSPASLTFTTTDWNVQKTVTVTAVPDAIDNPAEKRTVRITHRVTAAGEGTDYGTVTADPLDVTVTDDDGPPTVSVADADDVTEGDDTAATTDMTFTVTLSAASGKAVTVPYTLTGTATADEDYADPATKSVTVAAGGTTGTITIPVKGDTIDEGNETVTVTLGEPTNATVSTAEGAGTANGTITDDDTATLSVADASAAEGGTATFTVTLSTPSAATVTVTATTSEGTATDPEDYTHRTVTLTFAAGDTSKDFTVTTIADSVAELDETFTVTLSNPGGATIADATATGTITGAAALLSVADASATEGDAVAFTVTRTGDTAGPASVQWTTGDDASEGAARATAGTDYTARTTARTLSFQAGDATATFNVATAEDPLDEPDETFAVTLASPSDGVAISRASAVGTITDDDATPTATLVLAPATIDESGATNASTVTATLSGATSEAVTLTVSAGPGVTVSDNKVLTFAAGATASAGAVTLTAVDNDVDAADLGVSVSAAASGGNGVAAPAAVTLTVTDDDARGVAVSVKALTLAEADDSGTPGTKENEGTYTVALGSEPAAGTVTVAVASADTKAATVSPASLTFTTTDWNVQKTVTVTAVPDAIDNPAEKRTVRITHRVTAAGEGTDYGTVTADPLDVTVTDDDGPPTVSVADADDVTEGDDTAATTDMTFTVTLSAASGKAVTVPYTLTGTATADEDYADPATKSVTVAAGGTTGTITIPVKGDTIDEGNETVTVTLGEPTNATVSTAEGAGTANGTITDDDTATLSVADASAAEGGTATFTVTLSTPSAATVTVTATTSEGTATDPEDYTHRTVTLTFAAGDTSKDFTVTTIADSVAELDETFTVTLSNPGGATIADATATGTITGAAALLSVADASATEGDAVAFTVTRTGDTAGPASVQWTTGDDASEGAARATAGTDYTARTTARTLSFQAGDATATFNVATAEDPLDEPDETFAVTLASPSDGVAISRASAVGTITDDDATPTATLVLDPATIDESGATNASTVTATLSGATSEAVTLTVSAGPGVTVSDNKVLTFAAGATASAGAVTLTAVDNDVDAADLGVSVSAAASGGNGVAAPAAVTLTVTDDDARGVAVSVKALTLAEADDSGTPGTKENEGTYTVALGSEPAAGTVTVAVASADTKAATVSPASLTFTTTDWNVQKTVTVTAVPDAIDNPAEKRTVRITHRVTAAGEGTDYGTVTADPLDVTVTDDDGPPTVSVADADDVTEGDDTAATTDMTFTVTLSAASGKAVTVPYTLTGTATADEDYADPATKSVTVAAGGTTGTITIPVKGDTIDEGNETVTVTLGEPTNATVSTAEGAGTANGTITDDDTATLSVADASAAEGGTATFTVTLSTPSAATVTVTATTSEGTATDPEDYTHRTVTLTFAAGDTSKDFTVTTIADSVAELDETFTVTLSNPGGATIADATATGTITGAAALLSVADASATEGDAVAFTVTRTGDTAGPASVQWTTGDDASEGAARATAGTDYTARTTARTLSFQAGDATATFNVATAEDPLDEPDETFAVTLASPSDGVAISRASAVGTITDDDATPTATLVLDPATIDESGATNASTVTATLSGATSEAVTLTVSAGPGVTVSDNKVLTFAAGATASAGAVTLTAVDNDVDAADLGVSVSAAASGGNGVAAPAAVTLTVTDDDAPPVLSIDAPRVAEGDAGTATLTFAVGLSAASGRTVTVAYADAGTGTAAPGEDYAAVTAGTLTFAPGATRQTVAVAVSGDTTDEDDETVVLRLSSPAGATLDGGGTALDGTGTITDDDDAPGGITLSAEPTTVGEGAGGTTVTVTATVNGATRFAAEQTVTVSVGGSGSGDSATEGTDYAAVADFGIAIAAGAAGGSASFTLTPADDGVAEGDETVSIGGTLAGVTVAGTSVTVDDRPTLTVTGVPERISGRTPFTAAFTFSEPVTGFQTADVTVTGGAKGAFAGSGKSYTLEVTPGDDRADVVVTVAADAARDGANNTVPAGAVSATAAWGAVLSIGDARGPEGSFLVFPVRLSQASPDPVEVKWRTVRGEAWGVLVPQPDGSTWDGRDYDSGSGTLRFAPLETEKAVRVWANPDDGADDPGETFFVDIHDPVGAELAEPGNAYRLPLTPEVTARVDGNTSRAVGTITGEMPAPLDVSVGLRHGTVTEGGSAIVRVTAAAPYGAHRPVRIPLACGAEGDTAEPEDYDCPTGVTIHPGEAHAQAAVTISQDDDAEDEAFTVSLGAPEDVGGAAMFVPVAPASAALAVLDDDAPGTPGAEPPPGVDQELLAKVRTYAAEDFNGPEHVKRWRRVLHALTGGAEGEAPPMTAAEAWTHANRGWERWIPVAEELGRLEKDGHLRNPYAGLTASVADATAREGEEDLWFEITLSRPAPGPVTVRATTEPGTARSPGDYQRIDVPVRFETGERLRRLPVVVHDDGIDEGSETMELVLSRPAPAGMTLARARATGTIVNADPLPAAWLARFGRTVAQQALEGVAGRVAAPRTPGLEATLAGRAPGAGRAGGDAGEAEAGDAGEAGRWAECAAAALAREVAADGAEDPFGEPPGCAEGETRAVGEDEALLGTAFTLTSAPDGLGGTTAFWGRAARGGFDGGERDGGTAVALDGTVTTVLLGADRARGRWLAGVALARSRGAGAYRGADGAGAGGTLEASLTAAIPYGAWRASERLALWGALGRGTGAVTLATSAGEALSADTDWAMAAAGLRGDLRGVPADGPALALTSDALWARTSSERVRGLAASDSAVTRLRLGLEGGWTVALEGGATLAPRLEAGARHDGGDAETGFGIELGGGLAWRDPASGLSLDLSGRALAAHEAGGFRDWGLALDLAWDPAPETERGWSARLSRSHGGTASGGVAALLEPEALPEPGDGGGGTWRAEAAHGVGLGRGMVGGPYARASGTPGDGAEVRAGYRIGPDTADAADATLDLWAGPATAEGGRAVGAGVAWRW